MPDLKQIQNQTKNFNQEKKFHISCNVITFLDVCIIHTGMKQRSSTCKVMMINVSIPWLQFGP